MGGKLLFWIDSSLYNFINAKFIGEKFDCDLYSIYDITDNPKKNLKSKKLKAKKIVMIEEDIHA